MSEDPLPIRPTLRRTSISTTAFSRAYLKKAWETRDTLTDYERRGFAQFFYLTIAGHVEAVMVELISLRLMYIRSATNVMQAPSTFKEHSIKPLRDSLDSILNGFEIRVEHAPLKPLISLFQEAFALKLSKLLGKDLFAELDALADLRNIFAHGRQLSLDFEYTDENYLNLEGNPLENPAKRLVMAGILSHLKFDGTNHQEFQRAFFSDAAMLHFFRKAGEIETKLKTVLTYPPELKASLMISLSKLDIAQ